jgi:hypothetical protein
MPDKKTPVEYKMLSFPYFTGFFSILSVKILILRLVSGILAHRPVLQKIYTGFPKRDTTAFMFLRA